MMTRKNHVSPLCSLLVLMLAGMAVTTEAQNCPPGYKKIKGKCYKQHLTTAVGSSTAIPIETLFKAGEKIMVELAPLQQRSGKGQAEVTRTANLTQVNLKVEGMTGQDGSYAVYAVRTLNGQKEATLLGTVDIANGAGQLQTSTTLDRFALVMIKGEQTSQITENNLVIRSTAVRKVAAPKINK